MSAFSLPTQRCFPFVEDLGRRARLFSAYAEVFLKGVVDILLQDPFLCLRRGVSTMPLLGVRCMFFSLPTQRCFCVASGSDPLR